MIIGIIGILIIAFGFVSYLISGRGTAGAGEMALLVLLPVFVVSLPLLILGMLISKMKKWAWILTVLILILLSFIMLILGGCCTIKFLDFRISLPYLIFLLVLIPLILLLLDRKNFWKIAT